MKQITEAHLDEAIRMAKAGGGMGHKYNQRSWCGTSCCVLGFARLVAGIPERNQGPQEGEVVDTPKGRLIAALMMSANANILDVMERIQPDGTLDRPVHIDGALYLRGCTALTSLPAGLTVGGDLYLRGCTGLLHLPDGLTVGGSLDLVGCAVLKRLPEGLSVGGYLDLSGCTALTSLPDSLSVGRSLYLIGCPALMMMKKIPEHLRSKVVL